MGRLKVIWNCVREVVDSLVALIIILILVSVVTVGIRLTYYIVTEMNCEWSEIAITCTAEK